jgi:hypothetical protein
MRNGISTSNSGNTSASSSATALSQRSRLCKRSHQDQQQRDENHGAADQQQDLAEHIRVHQIFRVHLRLPYPASRHDCRPGRAIEIPLNRVWGPASRGQAAWFGG